MVASSKIRTALSRLRRGVALHHWQVRTHPVLHLIHVHGGWQHLARNARTTVVQIPVPGGQPRAAKHQAFVSRCSRPVPLSLRFPFPRMLSGPPGQYPHSSSFCFSLPRWWPRTAFEADRPRVGMPSYRDLGRRRGERPNLDLGKRRGMGKQEFVHKAMTFISRTYLVDIGCWREKVGQISSFKGGVQPSLHRQR